MFALEWTQAMDLGNPEMDRDHRRLIDQINALNAALLDADDLNAVEALMDVLLESTIKHFAYEEQAMRETEYSDILTHARQHQALLTQLKSLRRSVASGMMELGPQTIRFINQWLLDHIDGADRCLADHLQLARMGGRCCVVGPETHPALD